MIRFVKMTGSGNDFVMLDGRDHRPADWSAGRIASACDRRLGVGADGLVIVTPEGAPGTVRMDYYNADGSPAAMCGNAALCSVRLSHALGFSRGSGEVTLRTAAGEVGGRVVGDQDLAEISMPDFTVPAPLHLPLLGEERWASYGVVGVPHVVIFTKKLHEVNVVRRGSEIRYGDLFKPHGTNVNFVEAPLQAGKPWKIRTYERGVEGETLACGTGTVAAGFALAAAGEAALPVEFESAGGFPLRVGGVIVGAEAQRVRLTGQGRLVFRGEMAGEGR